MSERTGDCVGATETSFDVLQALRELGPARLTDIAAHLNLAESTTHRHLSTLEELRYVSKRSGRYQIGLRLAHLGQAAQTRERAFEMARPYVRRLADETEERAIFVAEDHGLGVYIHVEAGANAVRVKSGVGRQIHLHCTSSGKSILSQYDRDRVESILDRWGMSSHTERTITDREEYYDELQRVRERGYAFNRQEHIEGLNAAATPIATDDEVIGALAVSGPSHRLSGDRLETQIPELLLESANELQLNVSYEMDDQTDHLVE